MASILPARYRRELYAPVLAPVLRHRWLAVALAAAGLAQVALGAWVGAGWTCPIRSATGIPCPGCGLSEAIVALLRGDWLSALGLHAFAPLFLFVTALFGGVSLMPGARRRSAIDWIERAERRTGLTAWLLAGLLLYWLVRLATKQI